jgi:molybdopterin converting factor small subunit
MKVQIPSPLFSYTGGNREVEAEGKTLRELVADLDARYAGMRFRVVDEQGEIRPHMRFFVNRQIVRSLDHALATDDEVLIVAALSGG